MERINKDFKNIVGWRLRNVSPLHQFNILKDEDENMLLNIWKNYSISDQIKDNEDYTTYYEVQDTDHWDNIAYQAYENENLWWIVALTNDVVNPFEELDSGESIKLVRDDFIYKIIKDIKNISEI